MSSLRDYAARAWRRAPESVFVPVQARRLRKYWEAQGVIFIHIPKTAGTSVNDALYGRGMPHFRAEDVKKVLGPRYDELLSFAVVRDPLERAVSSYLFARSGGSHDVPMRRSAKLYQSDVFATFDSFVFEWLSQVDLMEQDFVFHPQYRYVCEGETLIVDELLPFHDLQAGLDALGQQLGRTVSLPRRNETRPGGTRGLLEVCPGTRKAVEQVYAADYEIFGFGARGRSIELTRG